MVAITTTVTIDIETSSSMSEKPACARAVMAPPGRAADSEKFSSTAAT